MNGLIDCLIIEKEIDEKLQAQYMLAVCKKYINQEMLLLVKVDGTTTFKTFLEKMAKVWADGINKDFLQQQMPYLRSKQDLKEIQVFIEKSKIMGWSDALLVPMLCSRIQNVNLKNLVVSQADKIKKVEDVVFFLSTMDFEEKTSSYGIPSVMASSVKCNFCGRMGHLEAKCWRKLECFNCKKMGHVAKFCKVKMNREDAKN